MKIKFDADLKDLAELFPVPLYAVGGYVRDSLLGYSPSDVDITSELPPEEVKKILSSSPYEVKDGSKKLLTLIIKRNGVSYEYTAFRFDSYAGGHRPAVVTHCTDIAVDASRRDFTVNAIYYDVKRDEIVDPLNGLNDLKNKTLRSTRSPQEVFSEDGLRLMRLARFAASLGFTPLCSVVSAAKENRFLIDEISKERVRDELDKILIADTFYGVKDAQYYGLELLNDIGVLERILPDLCRGIGMNQRSDFHKYDVFEHILHTVKEADKEVRLAALMHDVAKPYMMINTGFYRGHDKEGGVMTRRILTELRYPAAVVEETARLVENHMFNLRNDVRESTMRKFLLHNSDIAEKLVKLKYADYKGSGLADYDTLQSADAITAELKKMREEGVPFTVSELLVNGNDLKQIPSIPENKRGEVLNALLEERVLPSSPLTTKERQLIFITNYARRQKWITE